MINTFEAFVLHKQWLGDTSAKVSFFTRESGLLHCFYKGGRSPKKQALLQAFSPLWLAVNERYDRSYIHGLESRESPLALAGNGLFSGLYINELLYYTLSPMNPEPELFDAYLLVLKVLTASMPIQRIEALLRRFEWILLKVCGYSFSLTQEARTSTLIQADAYYRFIAGEGLVASAQGIPGAHILALATDQLHEAPCLHSAKKIMRQAIDHLVGGREIKARSLYKASCRSD
jgi:DNA repair protein RecO (recombination protein O)